MSNGPTGSDDSNGDGSGNEVSIEKFLKEYLVDYKPFDEMEGVDRKVREQ
jgi:hypothetical protein